MRRYQYASGGCRLAGEHVSDADLGEQVAGMGRISFDLMPHPVDVDLQEMALAHVLLAPHMIKQQILGHHSPHILGQIGQQAILDWGQLDLRVPPLPPDAGQNQWKCLQA